MSACATLSATFRHHHRAYSRPQNHYTHLCIGEDGCDGAKSEEQLASRKYARIVQKLGFDSKFSEFTHSSALPHLDHRPHNFYDTTNSDKTRRRRPWTRHGRCAGQSGPRKRTGPHRHAQGALRWWEPCGGWRTCCWGMVLVGCGVGCRM